MNLNNLVNGMRQEKGFLMVIAVVVIVIFALLGTALVGIYIRSTEASRHLQAIGAASALAESGMDQANRSLTQLTLANRLSCANLATNFPAPSLALSTGSYSLGGLNNTPSYNYTTLSSAIASTTQPTMLVVNDTSVLTPKGWIMIGREVFQYEYIANATTLGNVSRAQDGSLATAHVVGEMVSQYQCLITSTGNAPATNPIATRQYQQAMRQPLLFAVGQGGTILDWNGPSYPANSCVPTGWNELLWGTEAINATNDLNAVSIINPNSAWAASNQTGSSTTFARLQGNCWTSFSISLGANTNIVGIYSTSEVEAWAVGPRHGNSTNFLLWTRNATNDSTNWCQLPCGGKTLVDNVFQQKDKDLYAIKTYDTNGDGLADMGFAVGGNSGVGVLLYYSGTGWNSITQPPLNYAVPANVGNLRGLDITPNASNTPIEAFFVGQTASGSPPGLLMRLRVVNGVASWTTVTTTQQLQAVSVLDTNNDGLAEIGCAVGANGQIILFNNQMQTTVTTLPGNNTLNSALVLSANDIWVVGNQGLRYHYDGTNWTSLTNNVSTTNNLYSISGIYPQQTNLSNWLELVM